MVKLSIFSKGKVEDHNEDYFGSSQSRFVLADGATDKSGRIYSGKKSGEIVSRVIVNEALATSANGTKLVALINKKLHLLYQELGILELMTEPVNKFTGAFACVDVCSDKITITTLGDVGFRINGDLIHKDPKQVDIDNARERSLFIKRTGDVAGGRAHILPSLKKQYDYQNNETHPLGFGVIDGTRTPDSFVKVYTYDLAGVSTIELFTDGYFSVPRGTTIDAWEGLHAQVEREDPDKYIKYLSTKSTDDRTVAIISFQ